MRAEEKVAYSLIRTKKTLAVSESCTGGLLAGRLTNIPGSSNFFKLGLITYSNDAKIKLLKIHSETIRKHGAVSTKVAILMAQGARKILNTDFGIGITGIAGPTGSTKAKPIGLVHIAVCTKVEVFSIKCQFQGTRTSIKTQATTQALKLLSEFLP